MHDADAERLLTGERDRLAALREQVAVVLERDREGGQAELSTYDQHGADTATELHDLEVSEGVLASLDAQIDDVDHALRRVDEGAYGTCERCGRAVPDERLEAVPTARFCVEHEPDTGAVR